MENTKPLFVHPDGTSIELSPRQGESLLDALRSIDPSALDAPCGGAGTCGKCRIRILSGDAGEADAEERRRLGNENVAAGLRLACRIKTMKNLRFTRASGTGTAIIRETYSELLGTPDPLHTEKGSFGVAIDIGTTTVAAYLVDFEQALVVASTSRLNSQKAFGADVIARIDYAGRGKEALDELAKLIRKDLKELIDKLVAKAAIEIGAIKEIAIVGNTTMLHLFAAVDPSGIAVAPFTPAFTALLQGKAVDYGLPFPNAGLSVSPSLAAYVGGDIIAGMRAVGMERAEGLCLFLDLGTNGEMALGDKKGIIACATAAGPAFEGAAISRGTGGIAGAIDSLRWVDGKLNWTTIGALPPLGICGSGIIDAAACLVQGSIIEDSGAMDEEWSSEGYPLALSGTDAIRFTQADVRQIQLAKAAVAAGIGALLEERGAALEDISTVYLAGGFGSYLRPESAAAIGLIPPPLLSKVQAIGNAAGHGALRMLLFKDERAAMSKLATDAQYIELSGSDFFRDRFVEELFFPEPTSRAENT